MNVLTKLQRDRGQASILNTLQRSRSKPHHRDLKSPRDLKTPHPSKINPKRSLKIKCINPLEQLFIVLSSRSNNKRLRKHSLTNSSNNFKICSNNNNRKDKDLKSRTHSKMQKDFRINLRLGKRCNNRRAVRVTLKIKATIQLLQFQRTSSLSPRSKENQAVW